MNTPLVRSTSDKFLTGVCGGIARSFGIETWIVRIIFVAAVFFGFSLGFWAYLVLWLVLPNDAGTRGADDIKRTFSSNSNNNTNGGYQNPNDMR